MKLLAIDATEAACSAALLHDDAIQERCITEARQHNAHLLPMLHTLLADAGFTLSQLDGIAFARGPGSFTGVRIATAVTQGIALAGDLPVVPVSSLRALAQGVARQYGASQVLAGFDARMQEVYWGMYQLDTQGYMQLQQTECLCYPNSVPIPSAPKGPDIDSIIKGWYGAGSAWASYADTLRTRLGSQIADTYAAAIVRAHDVAYLAAAELAAHRYVTADQALPVYLRNHVARKASVPPR